jgi:hypothetical protein
MKLDIEKLFRNNHRNMDEQPPKGSWDVLRQRLDNHRTHGKIRRIQGLSIAAVVFAIISFGIVSLLYLQYQQDHSAIYSETKYREELQYLDYQDDFEMDMYNVENVKFLHKTLRNNEARLN